MAEDRDVPPESSQRPWRCQDRERLDWELADFLDRAGCSSVRNPHLAPFHARIREFVLNGGKRLRPRLCLAASRIFATGTGAASDSGSTWKAAASLELFHAFILVHDDLIDGSLTRRSRPALHEAFRADLAGSGLDSRAVDLGLIAGDLLFALGLRMMGEAGLEPSTFVRAHGLVSAMLFETGLGEALDVFFDGRGLDRLNESQILEAYRRKTAHYTLSGPLVLGAILAGAEDGALATLDRFGTRLGLAYQIRNDLDALAADLEGEEHPDLDASKRTLVLWKAHQRLGESGRRALVEALDRPPGVAKRRLLFDLIQVSGAVEECLTLTAKLHDEAVLTLDRSPLAPWRRRELLALIPLILPASPVIEHVVAGEPSETPAWTDPLPANWVEAP